MWWDAKENARIARNLAARAAASAAQFANVTAAQLRADLFAFECKDTMRGSDWKRLDAMRAMLSKAEAREAAAWQYRTARKTPRYEGKPTKDLLDAMDIISDARHFAEAIRMAFADPTYDEAKAIAALAFHVTTLLVTTLAGLEALSPGMAEVAQWPRL
ncbi:MAG: hypothetical protein JWS10_3060 [Cypionkella sp.]|uniref:hypothetical protein n=1 Tax=Cypionkella sp. TaxID=2811411 RepID=UPI00261CD717|nr:hypothetical protein [Cypionkella sp.]MDB5660445.1 hypothetical protein [Cypionkella sp.]